MVVISNTYAADGEKLKRLSTNGSIGTTDYDNGIIYDNGATYILTEEGRVLKSGSVFSNYEYNLAEHLGNSRVTFDSALGYAHQVQNNDYYPFGMEHSNNNPASPKNEYLYNKKELQEETGLYDYGMRQYDPITGRWTSIDPLAEKMRRYSPYNYGFDDPMRFTDPDGMGPEDWVKGINGNIHWDKNANSQSTTQAGETYLGKTLTFNFNSYIDGKTWDGPGGNLPVGDKLTSTIKITGNENTDGELTGISATKFVQVGETPIGHARDFYPGLGADQNTFTYNQAKNTDGTLATYNLNFEQHASVSKIEEFGLGAMGYNIVNVAQKLNVSISGGNLSTTSATDIFPSATLKMNGTQIMHYAQPSFKSNFSPKIDGYKPANWFNRQ